MRKNEEIISLLAWSNVPETLDEIIYRARFDYAQGDYKTFTNADDLIAELQN